MGYNISRRPMLPPDDSYPHYAAYMSNTAVDKACETRQDRPEIIAASFLQFSDKSDCRGCKGDLCYIKARMATISVKLSIESSIFRVDLPAPTLDALEAAARHAAPFIGSKGLQFSYTDEENDEVMVWNDSAVAQGIAAASSTGKMPRFFIRGKFTRNMPARTRSLELAMPISRT